MILPGYIKDRYWLRSYRRDMPPEVSIPNVSLTELVQAGMKKYPNQTAMIYLGKEISHGEMQFQIDHFAAVLNNWGIRKGETVALFLPNCPQFAYAYYGALKIGAMVTAISPMYTPPEAEFQLTDSRARTLVVEEGLWSRVEPVLHRPNLKEIVIVSLQGKKSTLPSSSAIHLFDDLQDGDLLTPPPVAINPAEDVAMLQYTGGTTGLPKAAMLTHRNIVANITQMSSYLDIMADINGVIRPTLVSVLPWYHIYAQTVDLSAILSRGGTVVALPWFDVEGVLRTIQDTRAQLFMGISSMFVALLTHSKLREYDLGSLVWCNNGASIIPGEVVRNFDKITGVRIVEGYGLSEASPVTHTTSPHMIRKIGSVGPPIPNTLQGIIDPETCELLPPGQPGELIIHGPQIMKGYWQRPQDTAEVFLDIEGQKWLRTGDIGVLDEDGYLTFLSRAKDLIKYKGHSVYSREIEEVLYQHPAISQAAVIGVPDVRVGENIKAFVVLKDELHEKITEREIISWARLRLAGYKYPRVVEFRREFPKSIVGKVLRRVLRDEELNKTKPEVNQKVYAQT